MRLNTYLFLLLFLFVCDWADDARFGHSIFSDSESAQPACCTAGRHLGHGSRIIAVFRTLDFGHPITGLRSSFPES